jgi:anti-sigma B factor antagonist
MTEHRPFRFEIDRDAGRVTVRPEGELDLATAPLLEAQVERIEGAERVVFDLRELTFLDSTGLQVILRAEAAARRDGVEFAVVRGPRAVERLFSVMNLEQRLRVVGDPSELAG